MLRGFAERENGSTVEIRMLDLSYEGCGIECAVALDEGEALKLTVMRRGIIEARVRWYKGGRAGLVFESDEAARKTYSPRRFERFALTADISMRRLGKLNYRVRVFDISPEGCKVELIDKPRLQEHVLVKLDGIEALEAEVCWLEGICAGLKFARPVHPAVFDLLLERLKASH
jgi:PilZ domain